MSLNHHPCNRRLALILPMLFVVLACEESGKPQKDPVDKLIEDSSKELSKEIKQGFKDLRRETLKETKKITEDALREVKKAKKDALQELKKAGHETEKARHEAGMALSDAYSKTKSEAAQLKKKTGEALDLKRRYNDAKEGVSMAVEKVQ